MKRLLFIMMFLAMDQATDHVTYRTLDRMIKHFAAEALTKDGARR